MVSPSGTSSNNVAMAGRSAPLWLCSCRAVPLYLGASPLRDGVSATPLARPVRVVFDVWLLRKSDTTRRRRRNTLRNTSALVIRITKRARCWRDHPPNSNVFRSCQNEQVEVSGNRNRDCDTRNSLRLLRGITWRFGVLGQFLVNFSVLTSCGEF